MSLYYNFSDKSTAWNFLTRKSTIDIEPSPATKKRKTEESYICVKCGSLIKRGGRESYIKRHWEAKHKQDISLPTMRAFIVPSNHEDAKTFLNKIESKKKLDISFASTSKEFVETMDMNPPDLERTENNPSSSTETTQQPKTTQKSIEGFLNDGQKEDETNYEHIQTGINQILLSLEDLKLKNETTNKILKPQHHNSDTFAHLKSLTSLKDMSLSDQIDVSFLDGCCKICCLCCSRYIKSHPSTIRYHILSLRFFKIKFLI